MIPVDNNEWYKQEHAKFRSLYGDEIKRLLSWEYCEIDAGFLGFLGSYADIQVPDDFVVFDFGCYMGLQAAYFENNDGAKLYSTEETKKGDRLEVINAYNSNREVMFQLPRDSFPETKLAKLVVWAMLFTRDGKLLIHKRGMNAKDNRNRWDKSVGGHVAVDDVDSAKAVAREIAEELYKHEAEGQGDHGKSDYDEDRVGDRQYNLSITCEGQPYTSIAGQKLMCDNLRDLECWVNLAKLISKKEIADEIREIVCECMENAIKLSVFLKAFSITDEYECA